MIMWHPGNVGTVHSTDLQWPLHKWQVTSLNQPWGDLRLPGGLEPPRALRQQHRQLEDSNLWADQAGEQETPLRSPRLGSEGYFSSFPAMYPPSLSSWTLSFILLPPSHTGRNNTKWFLQPSPDLHAGFQPAWPATSTRETAMSRLQGNCQTTEKQRLKKY